MAISGLQPWLQPYAQALMNYHPQLRITSTYRSWSDQYRLWVNRGSNPYPVAPPGRSYHQLGRAFDVSGPEEVVRHAGLVWRSWGGTWGDAFGDPIHFQA